ncbi:MAG: hypothetical protein QOH21_925 [Acidobacteriota bacterium]|jgi:hypothetical protein|nr:hypothetical protein [Acidobacteriota bacterium]
MIRKFTLAGAILLAATALAESHPNSVKYRDTGLPNASGRSGSASIEARALANRDGSADLEVTTGSFDDSAPAPGTIAKVQVKLSDVADAPAQNFNGLNGGGTFATTLEPLGRHDRVQVQASVRDIDGTRTDIVTVNETVKLRPDLRVAAVSVRPHAPIGLPTNIYATIAEANGDTGARADARLLVGGVEVDRAEDIWVDAGDSVQVHFVHVFETAGTASVQVIVDSVRPGDWDDTNNSASASMHIFAEAAEVMWSDVSARDEDTTEYHYSKTPVSELTREGGGFSQSIRFDSLLDRRIDYDTMNVSARVETDGQVIHEEPRGGFGPGFNRVNRFRCSQDLEGPVTGTICWDLPGRFARSPFTSVELECGAANVSYHSRGYHTELAPERPGDPYYIFDYVTNTPGAYTRLGSTVSFDIMISDALTLWHATPSIPSIEPSEEHVNSPYQCFFSSFYGGLTCQETRRDTYIRSGSAFVP